MDAIHFDPPPRALYPGLAQHWLAERLPGFDNLGRPLTPWEVQERDAIRRAVEAHRAAHRQALIEQVAIRMFCGVGVLGDTITLQKATATEAWRAAEIFADARPSLYCPGPDSTYNSEPPK